MKQMNILHVIIYSVVNGTDEHRAFHCIFSYQLYRLTSDISLYIELSIVQIDIPLYIQLSIVQMDIGDFIVHSVVN